MYPAKDSGKGAAREQVHVESTCIAAVYRFKGHLHQSNNRMIIKR